MDFYIFLCIGANVNCCKINTYGPNQEFGLYCLRFRYSYHYKNHLVNCTHGTSASAQLPAAESLIHTFVTLGNFYTTKSISNESMVKVTQILTSDNEPMYIEVIVHPSLTCSLRSTLRITTAPVPSVLKPPPAQS